MLLEDLSPLLPAYPPSVAMEGGVRIFLSFRIHAGQVNVIVGGIV